MKRIFKYQFWAMLLVSALAVGCVKDQIEELGGAESLGEPVAMSISVTAESMEAGTAETKSLATRAEENTIKNLWVIQVNGTEDSDYVVGQATYIADYKKDSSTAYLIPAENQTIVYIANTFDESLTVYSGATTLGYLKALSKFITTEEGCYTMDDEDKYLMMSGYYVGTIVGTTKNLSGSLKYNVAKVDVNIVNNCSDLTISSAQFVNVAKQLPYYTNQAGDIEIPYPSGVTTFNYDVQDLTFDSTTATLSTYITANMQGTSDKSISETTKPLYAPTSATYLAIYAYDSVTEQAVTYKMYLGADMESDYNIAANKHYTYTFTFNSVGEIGSDSRIEAMTIEVDYRDREDSNCYIINPSMVGSRTYYLPVQNRIDTFWTDYANEASKILSASSDNWTVEVLWYDCDNNPIVTDIADLSSSKLCIQPIYSDSDELDDKQQSVKVTLGEKFSNYGNVVFAVKSNNNEILWSWHLWITDYNPDSRDWTPAENQYRYATTGGEIHRYQDDDSNDYPLWKGGKYANAFIMDRNLGARGTAYNSKKADWLFYQYGRKDPFPGSAKFLDGSSYLPYNNDVVGPVSFATSVQDPTVFYTGESLNTYYNWCSEAQETSYEWNDVAAALGGDVKSIFDPSPLGWRVPTDGIWRNFDDEGSTYSDSNTIIKWNDTDEYGGYYYIDDELVAYYPANGYLSTTSAGSGGYGAAGGAYMWNRSLFSPTNAYRMQWLYSACYAYSNRCRIQGQQIRCVKDM